MTSTLPAPGALPEMRGEADLTGPLLHHAVARSTGWHRASFSRPWGFGSSPLRGLFPAADWNQKPMVLKNLPCAILLISPLHGARAGLSDPLHPSFPAGRPVPGGCSSSIIADMRSMQGCRMTAAACLPLVMIRRGLSLIHISEPTRRTPI